MSTFAERIRSWLDIFRGFGWVIAAVFAALSFITPLAWKYVVRPVLARRTIYARKFVVVDASGRCRASLGPGGDNKGVGLVLYATDGTENAEFDIPTDGDAVLKLFDKHKLANGHPRPRAALGVSADDGVALQLFDFKDTRPTVTLAVDRKGSVGLGLGQLSEGQFRVIVAEGTDKSGLSVSSGKFELVLQLAKREGEKGTTVYRPVLGVLDSSRRRTVWHAIGATSVVMEGSK